MLWEVRLRSFNDEIVIVLPIPPVSAMMLHQQNLSQIIFQVNIGILFDGITTNTLLCCYCFFNFMKL